MKVSHKEIILLLSGDEYLNEQVKAYSRTLRTPVNIQEQMESPVSSTIYQLIMENTDSEPSDLVDRNAEEYEKLLEGHELTEASWVTLLKKHPELLRVPIAVRGEKVVICDAPSKLQNLDPS